MNSSVVLLICSMGFGVRAVAAQRTVKKRFGDTPIMRNWIKAYDCPASATRLPPIRVSPPEEFSAAEACAVSWRARNAWMKANNLGSSLIDPRDSMPVTQLLVFHPHYRIIVGGDTNVTRPNTRFSVTLYRGTAPAVIVDFPRNGDAESIGMGHREPPGTLQRVR